MAAAALYLGAALLGGLLAVLLRLPPLVGFLAAGFALGAVGRAGAALPRADRELRGRPAALRDRAEARRPHPAAPRDLADHGRAPGDQRRDRARVPRPARRDRVRLRRRRVVRRARARRVRAVVLLDRVRRQGARRPLRHHLALRAHRRRCARHAGRRRRHLPVAVQRRAAEPLGAAARPARPRPEDPAPDLGPRRARRAAGAVRRERRRGARVRAVRARRHRG